MQIRLKTLPSTTRPRSLKTLLIRQVITLKPATFTLMSRVGMATFRVVGIGTQERKKAFYHWKLLVHIFILILKIGSQRPTPRTRLPKGKAVNHAATRAPVESMEITCGYVRTRRLGTTLYRTTLLKRRVLIPTLFNRKKWNERLPKSKRK